ncbi:hypothetical protein B0I00_0448 [Novosphingobium kunmingense]|uniref:DUF3618 domain-containing protein n=1 Tax=Novosphingobium kunmingense TaxID=1211806 RepID=A0A2N0I254_9SPHN|nr:hypothetical protein [Novosphingobium kunmingense]PKB25255.1 hypothetical protein B0I00_0448 [Novosphingobium kunmingense]
MTEAERRLAEDRATRQAAKANYDAGVNQVKRDLSARSVPGRVVDTIKTETTEAIATGLDVAADNKRIVAAVAGGIGLWLFRGRIARLFGMGRQDSVNADGCMFAADDADEDCAAELEQDPS